MDPYGQPGGDPMMGGGDSMMGGGSMGGGMGGGMGDSMGGGMGGPMGDGMGDPMMGGGDPGMGGMQVEQKPRPHHGWNGHFVIWSLGPKMHNLIIYFLLGASFFMLFLVCVGCPQIKEVWFIAGKLEGDVGQIDLGWLGACIYDTSSDWYTCTKPSYPLNVGNFGDVQGRLEAVAKIFDSNAKTRSLAFNVGSSVLTGIAIIMHRAGRNRGPFYFTCAAAFITWVAFFVDISIFSAGQKEMQKTSGLEPTYGLAMLFAGLACPAETIACFVSYSRSVKAQTNWPHADPAPKGNGGPEGGMMGGGAPMGGDPMMGGGDPMMGGGGSMMGGGGGSMMGGGGGSMMGGSMGGPPMDGGMGPPGGGMGGPPMY